MLKLSLLVRLEAKPGKENEVADFLQQGLQLANQEATTAALPSPNAAAREAAAAHDVRVQAEKVERLLQKAAAQ